MRHHKKSLSIPLLILAFFPAWSDDGRIPIWEPGVIIDQPGSYYLARDLQFDGGAGIVIGAGHVDLDLNGRTITPTGAGEHAILIVGNAADVTVRNGRLVGAGYGIRDLSMTLERLRIEGLEIVNASLQAIQLDQTDYFEMVDCLIVDAFEGVQIAGTTVRGRVVDNTFVRSRLDIQNAHAMEIRRNVIASPACNVGNGGIEVLGEGNRFVENVVAGAGCPVGVRLLAGAHNVLQDNVVVGIGFAGISVAGSDGGRVSGNVVNGNDLHGVELLGPSGTGPARVLVEGNLAWKNNEYGVFLSGLDADGNASSAYRDNMLRGNLLGPVSDPENALTDEGGNIE